MEQKFNEVWRVMYIGRVGERRKEVKSELLMI